VFPGFDVRDFATPRGTVHAQFYGDVLEVRRARADDVRGGSADASHVLVEHVAVELRVFAP